MPNPLSDALAELLAETVGLVKEQRELARESTTLVRLLNRVIGDLVNPPDTEPPGRPGPLILIRKEQIAMGQYDFYFAPAAPANPADVAQRKIVVTRFGADGVENPAKDEIPVALDATEVAIRGEDGHRFLASLSDADSVGNWSTLSDPFDSGVIADDVPPAQPGALSLLRKEQIFDAPPVEPPVEPPPAEEPPAEPPAAG